jgi:hypothetical protein
MNEVIATHEWAEDRKISDTQKTPRTLNIELFAGAASAANNRTILQAIRG